MQNVKFNVLKKRNMQNVASNTNNNEHHKIDKKVASIVDSKQLKFNVLKKQNKQNVASNTNNNEYHEIDEKVASIVNNKQYEDFFKTPREVFGRTLPPDERQYYIQKILPYQMQQLGYKGVISDYYKDNITAYANYLTKRLEPIYNKKQNTPHAILTDQELELCRKIQKAYTGVLQLSGPQKDKFKISFPILDKWMHNHKVPTTKRVEVNKTYDTNYAANIWHKNRYKVKAENDGFLVNTHTTMDKKKKQQTNILLSANNKEQDNKLLGNKRKIEDCLFNVFDNEDFTKKNNSFYPNFNDNEYENNSIGNNLLFNDNVDKNNSIGNNNNVYNKSLFNLNCDKTFKGFGK